MKRIKWYIVFSGIVALFGVGMIKVQQNKQAEQRNAELGCAKGNYHWDLPYADCSFAEEAVKAVILMPDIQVRKAGIRASQYNSIQIGKELENDNQISPDLNFQLNVILPNQYFMEQNYERSIVVHVHYPAVIKAGESDVILVHLKDSNGEVHEGEYRIIATDDLWLTPGFMDYDGVFWENQSFDTIMWSSADYWKGRENLDSKDRSDVAVFRFYTSTSKVDVLEEGHERGCRYGGCPTIVYSFYDQNASA